MGQDKNVWHFADSILKCISLNENASIMIQISLKIVSYGSIDSIEALLQVMAW